MSNCNHLWTFLPISAGEWRDFYTILKNQLICRTPSVHHCLSGSLFQSKNCDLCGHDDAIISLQPYFTPYLLK